MDITILDPGRIIQRDGQTSPGAHRKSLERGLEALGATVRQAKNVEEADTSIVACWGWRNGKTLRKKGHEVLVMERSYIADRFHYCSLAWNGLNGHATFPFYPDDGGARFKSVMAGQYLGFGVEDLPRWREKGGDYVLLLGQVPRDASLGGRDLLPWYKDMAVEAADHYGLPVHFRPHPDLARKGLAQKIPGTVVSQGSLEDALAGAALVVTWNSNSAVDAVLAGVPALTYDKGSMAWPVTGHAMSEEVCPDRARWAAQLAFKQWAPHEIEGGAPLRKLLDMVA